MGSLPQHQTCPSKTPHFFKIILEDTSRNIKLGIPKKFVMKYGDVVSNTARLRLPSSAEWEVKLTRCNGKVWFEKGWPEFYKFCSLDYGGFLVFRYEGNSIFHVCIFDRSATEIDYPIKMPKMEETDHEAEAEDDGISIEILEHSLPRQKTREKSPSPCTPLYKKMRRSWSGKAAETMFENDDGGSSTARRCSEGALEDLGTMQSVNESEIVRAHLSADVFISEKPHFKVVMQPSYFRQSYLNFPLEFLKNNLIKDAANVTLRVSNGKTWSVKFKYEKSKAMLQLDWLAFVKDNYLKVGDVCTFVLMSSIELLFQVEVSRAKSFPVMPAVQVGRSSTIKVEPDCSMNCGKNQRSETSVQVAERSCSFSMRRVNLEAYNKFIPNNPFFEVSLRTNILRGNVHVRASFIKSCIRGRLEKQTVMLQGAENRLWPVNLIPHNKVSGRLCGGWLAFVREHDLKEGDVCGFELMEKKSDNIVLKVHIFKCD